MHVGMLGHCEAIIDVNTTLLPSSDGAYAQVYGASRCKEWAWLNVRDGDDPSAYYTTASINREVVMNGAYPITLAAILPFCLGPD